MEEINTAPLYPHDLLLPTARFKTKDYVVTGIGGFGGIRSSIQQTASLNSRDPPKTTLGLGKFPSRYPVRNIPLQLRLRVSNRRAQQGQFPIDGAVRDTSRPSVVNVIPDISQSENIHHLSREKSLELPRSRSRDSQSRDSLLKPCESTPNPVLPYAESCGPWF